MAINPAFDEYSHMFESAMARLVQPAGGVEVAIEGEDISQPQMSPSGALTIPTEDGGVIVQFPGAFSREDEDESDDFERNLALEIPEGELGRIADDLILGIQQDDADRKEWLDTRAKGIDLLALKIESPRSDAGGSAAPLEGMSSVRNPLLLEAVLRFQANARGELLPSSGPVKVKNVGLETNQADADADALERDMNTYLTVTAPEYYPDTDRLLLFVGFGGCGFKKVYHCPLRNRPVSESVDAKDFIVSSTATDLQNAPRKTHQILMHPDVMRLMQLKGVYRDVELSQPTPTPNAVQQKMDQTQGIRPSQARPKDQPYTLYECYCNLDLPGFEHKGEDGEATGYRLPYRVTIDKDSKEILEIRRNWSEQDDKEFPEAKRVFVKYSFVPGMGFYDIGLLNILGNASQALTAAWRLALDNGMFSNFPGFVYSKSGVGRQLTNEFRIAPGSGVGLDVQGPIGQAVMPLPYKSLSGDFMSFMELVQQTLQRVGGTAESNVGEGRQDAPVGTTLALIEQATKIMDAVHKRLHSAQAEEFQLLKARLQEDPGALRRHNDRARLRPDDLERILGNYDLVPVADPNTPSSMHRHAKTASLMQLVQLYPALFNIPVVLDRVLRDMKFDNPNELLAPPQASAPQPDPKVIALQQKQLMDQAKIQQGYVKMAHDAEQGEAERRSKETLALMQLANTQVIHPYSAGIASNPAVPKGIARPTP